MTPDRCQIGNPQKFHSDGRPSDPPCPAPPAVRYRSDGMVPGHWNFRCAAHAEWLNAPGLIVEQLNPHEDSFAPNATLQDSPDPMFPEGEPPTPVTDDDLWQIPAEYRDTVARWLIQRAATFQPSMFLSTDAAPFVQSAILGAAVDLAAPGADDTTADAAQAVLTRLSGRKA